MPPLDTSAVARLEEIRAAGLERQLKTIEREGGAKLLCRGISYISFSCNDYLGLSLHPEVIAAAETALHRYGAGAGASRLVTGSHPVYLELESMLAKVKKTEAALVVGSGYLANVGLISALAGKDDLIVADKLVHACILDGIKLSGATLVRFRHNDVEHARTILKDKRKKYQQCFVITETVFSMDGDLAPVAELKKLAESQDATLITDDAHGLGIIKSSARAHIQMGTLSKAAGSYGGYICASKPVIKLLTNTMRSMIFSTGLPPASVAASTAALQIMQKHPELAEKALGHAKMFAARLDLPEPLSTIVPLVLGSEKKAVQAAEKIAKHGFWVGAIRPPAVPKGTARLRFTFSALHQAADISRLVAAIRSEGIV
jgi:8-amino-7-oxononanoate synthase